jgi:hypothetical protein
MSISEPKQDLVEFTKNNSESDYLKSTSLELLAIRPSMLSRNFEHAQMNEALASPYPVMDTRTTCGYGDDDVVSSPKWSL